MQGVGFRWFVQKAATSIGISGYTRNLDDGRVEVYAVGSADQLNALCGMLWRGPRSSDVRGVEEEEAGLEKMSGFAIKH